MSKLRLLFVKEGTAAYISHLDLLRTVQRAFPRTELEIKHSQGFHPHPIISIVLPLPVAQSSDCELLDFEVTQDTDGSGIAEKLNEGLPEGLRVLDCYEAKRPVRELAYLRADMEMEYDHGVPEGAAEALMELFHRPELLIEKRTKRKQLAEVDIAPMIRRHRLCGGGGSSPGGGNGPGRQNPRPEPPAAGKGYCPLPAGPVPGLCSGSPPGSCWTRQEKFFDKENRTARRDAFSLRA